jgi:SagB-type dehydrogenase family enzyme
MKKYLCVLCTFVVKFLSGGHMKNALFSLIILTLVSAGVLHAQNTKTIKLLEPVLKTDKLFMDAIRERKSSRDFAVKELSLQDLSNVLWCANGINRPADGHRTAPSAMNKQDVDVYAVMKDGIWLYDAATHELVSVVEGDFRKDAGMQDWVGSAPLNLIYVSDLAKLDFAKEREAQVMTGAIDAGHCSQNVYLYCAAAKLSVVVRTSVDKKKLAEILKLRPQQIVIAGQTVGYPK